jgi:hypothetical protein
MQQPLAVQGKWAQHGAYHVQIKDGRTMTGLICSQALSSASTSRLAVRYFLSHSGATDST